MLAEHLEEETALHHRFGKMPGSSSLVCCHPFFKGFFWKPSPSPRAPLYQEPLGFEKAKKCFGAKIARQQATSTPTHVHHGHVAATVLHAQQQDKEQNKNQAYKSKLKSKKSKNKSNKNSKEKSKNKSKKSKIKFSSKSKIKNKKKNQLKKQWFSLIVIKIRCSGSFLKFE